VSSPPNRVEARDLPLVTIVSPSLDQGAYIEATIESVLSQDYPRLEYIVVDGGSSDGTLDRLRRYEGRLRWISQRDEGQAAAINKGFAMGTGEILGWLNCDDGYEPGAITRVVRSLVARPDVMMVYGEARFVDAAGRDLGPCDLVEPFDLGRLVHWGDIVAQPAAFFRRTAFEAVSGLDETLHWTMDYDLWIRIGRRFPVQYVPERLAWYRLTGANKTLRGGQPRLAEIAAVARRHGAAGLPAAFRIEQLIGAVRGARRSLREAGLISTVRALGAAVGAVLASPLACRGLAAMTIGRLRSRGKPAPVAGGGR
jgi:GT2 family glycosyltransferase